MQINNKVSTSCHSPFRQKWTNMSTKQEAGNIFSAYCEKSVATAFVFYYDAKDLDILRDPVMFVVTCF